VLELNQAANRLEVRFTPSVFFGLMMPDGRVDVKERWSGGRPAVDVGVVLDRLLKAAIEPR
jgi:hypothetical protein